MRTDDYSMLKDKLETKELPEYYTYDLDKRHKNLTLTLSERGLSANMQDNESAFESWALVLRFYL